MPGPRLAENLSVAGTVRGLIIAYGIGAYALISRNLGTQRDTVPFSESPLNLILIGLGVQALRWVVMWAVARYEKSHDIEGALSPTVMYGVDLVIDGVTVLLFAVATFRSISGVAAGV
jgi:hypothetical protein